MFIVYVFCETGLATDNGWPRALQACKGDGKKRQLDQDKKGGSKGKKKGGLFLVQTIAVWIEGRACKNL
jgi:hypothetical protein